MNENGCPIPSSFAFYTPDDKIPDFITKRPSIIPPEAFSAFHDVILGTFMEESAFTANASRDMWTPIISTGNGAHDKAEGCAGETEYTSSKKLLLETLQSTRLHCTARRWAASNV